MNKQEHKRKLCSFDDGCSYRHVPSLGLAQEETRHSARGMYSVFDFGPHASLGLRFGV